MLLMIIILVVVFVLLHVSKQRENGSGKVNKKISPYASKLANQYVETFKNSYDTQKMDSLSEDLIQMANNLWQRGDYDSYMVLLKAAEETSYIYHGRKYHQALVEDIIRESHN